MARRRETQRREDNEVEFSRIVAFSDGVFAIAITLLVLSLNVPDYLHGEDLSEALWNQRHDFLAYAISFAVIGRFWVVHHRFFGEVVGFDARLLGLNIFYLAWIVLIPFSSEVLGDHGGETPAVVLYAFNLAAVALVGLAMAADARRAGLARTSAEKARQFTVRSLFIAAVFLASIPLAFVTPSYAPLLWLVLFFDPSRRVAAKA
ncbi:MAG TPA: TMEM175 family protein [Solirubrobacterales bacterium]|nr:TMEM175 family protein [Solirubrobacterales bacterium]